VLYHIHQTIPGVLVADGSFSNAASRWHHLQSFLIHAKNSKEVFAIPVVCSSPSKKTIAHVRSMSQQATSGHNKRNASFLKPSHVITV
jgi:hypothetical protein